MEFRLCPGAPPPVWYGRGPASSFPISGCDNSRGGTRAERRAVSVFFTCTACMRPGGIGPAPFQKLLLLVTRLAARSRKEVFVSVLGLACARPSCCPNTSFSCVTRLAARSRKEVFQPHLPVRLPCYDLAPITGFTLGRSLRVTDFRRPRLSWLDGRCVQGPGTYSPRHG